MNKFEENRRNHIEATKKGQEAWLIYRDIWLEKLKEFPNVYPTYNDKISHISKLWRIRKKSIADRRKENLITEFIKQEPYINRQKGFNNDP